MNPIRFLVAAVHLLALAAPDVFLNICKQRHGNFEGVLGFWFDPPSGTYSERSNGGASPMNFHREPGEDDE